MIWFTSDLHFNHERIIQLCNRPFKNVDDMNVQLINNWNNKVSQDDTVYILGDVFARGDDINYKNFLDKLNGHKVLVKGNHDRNIDESLFDNVYDKLEIIIDNILVIMSHYPVKEVDEANAIFLHGHTHNSEEYNINNKSIYDVGVDANGYKPISLVDILKYTNL